MEKLYALINKHKFKLIDTNIPVPDVESYCYGDMIFMDYSIKTQTEYRCLLAEEIGHQFTSYGNILDYKNPRSYKQEIIARRWSYRYLIPLHKLIEAYKYGCRNRYETADFLDVTENILQETVNYYKVKYGIYHQFGDYVLCFDPLGVKAI